MLFGVALGVWCAFLVPLRLPGGVEGLADVVALVGTFVAGVLAARGVREVPAAVLPGIGWLLATLVLSTVARPSDEVVIPAKIATDPGIGTVGALLLFAGSIGAVAAAVVANRSLRHRPAPASTRDHGVVRRQTP